MGVVYRVSHPQLSRPRALKLLLEREGSAPRLARFAREAEAMARVQHPNVVAVHEQGRCERGPYLVTELVEGQELGALLEGGPLEPSLAARIVRDLAAGAHALHQAGVLHRDIKPSNAILTPEGRAVLLDLGLAYDESAERLTKTGEITGTPAFMSPEQATGDRAAQGPPTDVYGLGAVLYALLTGRAPFEGELLTVLRQIVLDPPEWPPALEGPIPAALVAVCEQALAKAPGERYPSALALQEDLERVLAGEAPLARPPRARARALPWAVGAALLLGALGFGLLQGRSGDPSGPTEVARGPEGEAQRLAAALDALQRSAPASFAEQLERTLAEPWPSPAERELRALAKAEARLRRLEGEGWQPWSRPGSARKTLGGLEAWRRAEGQRFALLEAERARPLAWRLQLQAALESEGLDVAGRHWGAFPRLLGAPHDRLLLCDPSGQSKNLDLRVVSEAGEPRQIKISLGDARARAIAVHPSGALLVAGAGEAVYEVDLSGGAPPKRYPLVLRPETQVCALACTSDTLAVGYGDGYLALYAWPPGARPARELQREGDLLTDLAFLEGGLLAACDARGLTLWDAARGKARWTCTACGGATRLAVPGPGSRRFAAIFPTRALLALFELAAAEPTRLFGEPGEPGELGAAVEGALPVAFRGEACGVAWSQEAGLVFALGGQTSSKEARSLRVWDAESGALVAALHEPLLPAGVTTFALTPEGSVALARLDGAESALRLWRLGPLLAARPPSR